ncbi:ATP-binding protein [Dongia deserti]|uniref:ATP-binding protein n=1 Tax=Dongia deserti TaxID=2268030 RepID=UPI000E651D80|nr:ATP-binding protein [Dongia deserti]
MQPPHVAPPGYTADRRGPVLQPIRATVFPIVGLIFAMAATIGIMVWFSAREVDRQYAEDTSARIKLVVANLRSAAKTVALDYAWWDEAYEKIHVQYDPDWADSTFEQGTVLGPDESVDGVILLGPDSQILFAKWQGKILDPAATVLEGGLADLAEAARADASNTSPGPTPQAGYLSYNGQLAIAAASGLMPYEKAELSAQSPGISVLVMLRSLTPEYLEQVSAIYGIVEPRIVEPRHAEPSEQRLAATLVDNVDSRPEQINLTGRDGTVLGQLVWAPAAPGQSLMATLAPAALLAFIVLGAIGLFVLWQIVAIRRVTREQMKVIEARNDALRKSAQMLGATIQSIEDGIAVWDRDRKLQHWNRAYMQMWQFPESFLRSGITMDDMLDELAGSGRAQRLETDDRGRPATDPKAFEQTGHWLYRRADGRLLSVRRLPIGDEGYMAICSDLTAQKQHEDELVKAWEQAVIANRSKSEFLANVSHELRTPLNAIIGFSEVVERELFGPLGNERYVSYVRDIRNSGEHLLSLINDILDLSKIEAGRFQLRMEEVDCNEIAHSVARLIRPRTVEHGLTMHIDLPERPIVLHADKRAVKQVLINLLSNAVKFTPENGTVTLTSRPWHDGVEFVVSDTGIGIDEKDMHVALAPFGQIDSQFTRKYEGTGLGLPIVKGIVELHGGTLEIKSEPNQGTSVIVRFPNHPSEHPIAEILSMPRKHAAGH